MVSFDNFFTESLTLLQPNLHTCMQAPQHLMLRTEDICRAVILNILNRLPVWKVTCYVGIPSSSCHGQEFCCRMDILFLNRLRNLT